MNDHVIICGLGHVGYRCFTLLRSLGERVVVICEGASADWRRDVEQAGMTCIVGDARDDRLLVEAGIHTARSIIAATDQDMVNLSIAMDARRLNPRVVVVMRLFDQRLAPHMERALGIRQALSTSALAAPSFAAAALGGHEVCRFLLGERTFTLAEAGAGSPADRVGLPLCRTVAGHPAPCAGAAADEEPKGPVLLLREAPRATPGRDRGRVPRWAAVLWRWQRGAAASIPRPIHMALAVLAVIAVVSVLLFEWVMKLSPVDAFYFLVATLTTTGYGDISFSRAPWQLKLYGSLLMLSGGLLMATLVSVMTDRLLSLRLRDVLAERRLPSAPHVIVAGLGNVGHRIVRELLESGESVVVVTRDADDEHMITLGRTVMIVVGDPAREECLKRAGLGRAKAVVAVTDDDVTNLGIAIRAKTINPTARTVIRVFDATLAEKLQRDLSFDSVMSVSAVSAPTLVAVALHPDARYAAVWRDHLLTVFHERGGADEPDAMAGARSAAIADLRVRLGRAGDDVRPELLPAETRGLAGDDVLRIRVSPLRSPG